MRPEKKDEDSDGSYLLNLDKGLVLQEARVFHDPDIKPDKCIALISKILYLLHTGERLTTKEATEVFFSLTKLFQSKDPVLRRMVYLCVKELTSSAEDVIILVSTLTKDITSKTDTYRANAIRVLTRVTDAAMLGQIERHLKQAIVDKNSYVASAALVSGVHLMNTPASDAVKRWSNEAQEACNSKSNMVQYHALGLMYQIKQHDRLAVSKLVSSLSRGFVRSPHAHCLLIRFASRVADEDPGQEGVFADYLESCLRHKSEMVMFEAARAICSQKNVSSKRMSPAITVLQLLLCSPRTTLRFAAVRTLNQVAMNYPMEVSVCNIDLETLITDTNRSIATLAITTLLKTGSESSVDRLMKQIMQFMSEIPDEFKVVVIDAIKTLSEKFPNKHRSLMNFLSNVLRDEGSLEYKKSIVDTILSIIKLRPDSKDAGLSHLCEFIEDCEFPHLLVRILHVLGKEGPQTSNPSKYIRYIYNRVILENAQCRAAAVSALARFGIASESLRESVVVLLRRCRNDNNDEVRDRATFFIKVIEDKIESAQKVFVESPATNAVNLEQSLLAYVQGGDHKVPFNLKSVPTAPVAAAGGKGKGAAGPGTGASGHKPVFGGPPAAAAAEAMSGAGLGGSAAAYAEEISAIAEFAHVGKLLLSSRPVELTEQEAEYSVSCVKHFFAEHLILQFNLSNTMEDQRLDNVNVQLELPEGFEEDSEKSVEKLVYSGSEVSYVCLRREADDFPTGTFPAALRFRVYDIEPGHEEEIDYEEGYDDEYQIEDIDVSLADYMGKSFVRNFRDAWEAMGDEDQVTDTFALSSMKSLPEAVSAIVDVLGMVPCENSADVPSKKTQHALYLCGAFLGEHNVLARARLVLDTQQGVNMELAVRSKNPVVRDRKSVV